jgi:ABC-type phosphate transport system permease subunit
VLSRCLRRCLQRYGHDLGMKATAIIVGCLLAAAALGDFTGTTLGVCLAAGGVADVSVGLSACIVKCIRSGGRDV